jgi:predicted transcriptional regulator
MVHLLDMVTLLHKVFEMMVKVALIQTNNSSNNNKVDMGHIEHKEVDKVEQIEALSHTKRYHSILHHLSTAHSLTVSAKKKKKDYEKSSFFSLF